MTKRVHVAVGVIYRQGQFFLTKRLANAHQGGKWEFPGGKVEDNETVHQALHRELQEEIAIDTLAMQPLIEISHDYVDKQVLLEVFLVDQFAGEPTAQEGQQQGWFSADQLSEIDFPKANDAIVAKIIDKGL
ncbi:8-oxo-dGTP diphosphatase MutT [Thalassotalea sp. HSM 43]|uniref:8-oxo-dGTP diphosphatase MutT n=1 Tax=Thalassotalea sp. HSM 43 TaxID=2552945 RepID=UPI001081A033|nr:8-oxo-dGTP diphosphatase MutT [Thalassotalea sp. HSM 43]QBY06199.1 8-oxo-dGTP diphosphatase MutT [Thalassotalea sp. HSM 43]